MRKPPSIAEEQLRACFQNQYDLIPVTLEFLPLGLDYNAGVYRVVKELMDVDKRHVAARDLGQPKSKRTRQYHATEFLASHVKRDRGY